MGVKQIITNKNIVVFKGEYDCLNTEQIELFIEKGSDVEHIDFEPNRAFFTDKTKEEVEMILTNIKVCRNFIQSMIRMNDKFDEIFSTVSIDVIKLIGGTYFSPNECEWVF